MTSAEVSPLFHRQIVLPLGDRGASGPLPFYPIPTQALRKRSEMPGAAHQGRAAVSGVFRGSWLASGYQGGPFKKFPHQVDFRNEKHHMGSILKPKETL